MLTHSATCAAECASTMGLLVKLFHLSWLSSITLMVSLHSMPLAVSSENMWFWVKPSAE